MKGFCLLLMAAFSVNLYAETVTKISAPFAFPTTSGVTGDRSFQSTKASFTCRTGFAGRSMIEFSWSLPGKAEKGSISVFTIAGSHIKTFSMTSQCGSVRWDLSASKKLARGIYIATLSYGIHKQNLKIVQY
jgi:hypothetical protein